MKGVQISETIRNQIPRPQFPHSDTVGHILDLAHQCDRSPSVSSLSTHPFIGPFRFPVNHNNESNYSDLSNQETVLTEFMGLEQLLQSGRYVSAIILCRLEGLWDVYSKGDTKANVSILFTQTATRSDSNHLLGTMYDYTCSTSEDSSEVVPDNVLSVVVNTIAGSIFTHNAESDLIDIIKDNQSDCSLCQLSFHATFDGWVGQITTTQLECLVKFKGAYISEIIFSHANYNSIKLLRPRNVY